MSRILARPRTRISFLLGILLLLAVSACRTEGPQTSTVAPTIESPSLVPQEIPMTTLLRNPASFEGQTIRVTGQYRSIPLLVCGSTIHRSPATWKLIFGDVETFASGFDEALRPLAASGLSLTIEGRWQKWEGPVGCGRRAPAQEIWYLSASRIVSPNPLVKSDSEDGGVVLLPSPTTISDPAETAIAAITPDVPPTATPETPAGNSSPTPSPTFQLIPTAQPGATATNTAAPTATSPANGGNSPTATATPTPTGSATPTVEANGTPVTDTPTPTASPTTSGGGSTPIDQGVLSFDVVEKQTLAANSSHSWRLNPPAGEPIIITAGSGLNINLKLDLLAPNGSIAASADLAATGKPETINFTAPNPTGEYQIVVSSSTATAGPYLLILFDNDSEPTVIIRDTLVYGSGGSGNIPAGTDHFWNFEAQAGDTISIEVSPTSSNGDLIFYLIDPEGGELEFVDETGVGESESLISYTLPDSGFYSIGIGESNFEPVDYSMTLIQ